MRGLQKMSNELVRVPLAGGQVAIVDVKLPELVERAGGAARPARGGVGGLAGSRGRGGRSG